MAQGLWSQFLSRINNPHVRPFTTGRRIPISLSDNQTLRDERRGGRPYISNAIKTSKYNILDFLPRQLFYQFSRLANFYMLLIAILQVIPGFSTTGRFTSLVPLVIFLSLLISKEAWQDFKRYREDVTENNRPVMALRSGVWAKATWKSLRVGHIILLARDEDVPADIVVLHADGQEGMAYVDTMALDGETSLKAKQVPPTLPDCSTIEGISRCKAELETEQPNVDLYRFDSKLTVGDETRPLTLNEVIYRGSTIRNTPHVVGIVVNTGEECKLRMNANQETRPKKPALEMTTNYIVVFLMFYVLLSSVACSVGYIGWKNSDEEAAWYLSRETIPFGDIIVGFIIMFNNVIPLSLYAGLEAIKIGQENLVSKDLEMYDEEADIPAGVNSTNNLDDLGQISYVFSDKTGTLTENIMKLRRVSIAGISWMHLMDDSKAQQDAMNSTDGAGRTTVDMLDYIRRKPESPFAIKATQYILAMALCHTCLPEKKENGEMDFQASSPDELALVKAAQELGMLIVQRSTSAATVQMTLADGSTTRTVFEILDVIEFTSKRKRMSIIVRCPDGRLWLICKGADSLVLPRLTMTPSEIKDKSGGDYPMDGDTGKGIENNKPKRWNSRRYSRQPAEASLGLDDERSNYSPVLSDMDEPGIHLQTQPAPVLASASHGKSNLFSHLESPDINDEAHCIGECAKHVDDYATEGLRTLIYADKFLDAHEYSSWKRQYQEAETSLENRTERIEQVSDAIEQSLHLVGASAVEDKLQRGVPETIENLRKANIKIWMLTGDKRETAINIAHSTRLVGPETALFVLDATEGNLDLQLSTIADEIQFGARTAAYYSDPTRSHTAIVIDGETLTHLEAPSAASMLALFLALVTHVDSVVCCRASPAQKAHLVQAIRNGPKREDGAGLLSRLRNSIMPTKKPLTLAIGDGANDLAMLAAANVGVGIAGREGQQAARVADFSISQFRYLNRLVLVHGRWNYYRTTRFILVTFWKETFFYFPQALYQSHTGGTGTSMFEPGALTLTSIFTAACFVVIGTWEQDLKARTVTLIPELFRYGQRGEGLNARVYLSWFANALVAGTITYAGAWGSYAGSDLIDDNTIYAQGTLTMAICVMWINIKILIVETHYKTMTVMWAFLGSAVGWWAYLLVVAMVSDPSAGPYSIGGGLIIGFGRDPAWWSTMIMVLCALVLLELVLKALKQSHVLRAGMWRCWSSNDKVEKKGGNVREGFTDWEPHLWQEMEKDRGVQEVLDGLTRKSAVVEKVGKADNVYGASSRVYTLEV